MSRRHRSKVRWIHGPAAALMIIGAGQGLLNDASGEEALTDVALAQKIGCLQCHSQDKNGIGPAFHDIAVKYKDDARARVALIETVKNGGKGKWTAVSRGVPMPPYSQSLSDAEIARLVDWLMAL